MDPSAPPKDLADEKSSMAHAPPPPYQDPLYPQPGPAYPPQQQLGYGPPPQYGGAAYEQQLYPKGHQYPEQPVTVTAQPTLYVTRAPLTNPVNDYLCYSIFTMLCCCLPLGIAALIYSILTREASHIGDQMGAERNSRMARTLNHVALGVGIGLSILSIVYIVIMAGLIA